MKSMIIDIDENDIIFKVGVEEMVYKTDINSFVENTGVTIQNVSFPIQAYYINLLGIGKQLTCGNIIENLFAELKQNNIDNALIVMDFNEVEEISENFYQSYTKILLETSNKIITINMNTALSNGFASFVKKSLLEKIEVDEE